MDKRFFVDNKIIQVIDGLLEPSQLAQYTDALDGAAFTRTEIATPATAKFRHFVSEMPIQLLLQLPLYPLTLAALQALTGAPYRAYRAYTNLALPGDVLFSHTDCLPDQSDFTALWYLCQHWDRDWAGETIFLDAADEVALATLPKPGRLVLFDGRIRHAGRPPSQIAAASRYTFAIKFERAS